MPSRRYGPNGTFRRRKALICRRWRGCARSTRRFFRYTVGFPEFHRFMRQETLTNNPRLKWVAETVLTPLLGRLLPQIATAQQQGLLPTVAPILFHYMMVSLTATLSEFGLEMQVTSGLSSEDPKVVEAYWRLVDETVFEREPKRAARSQGHRCPDCRLSGPFRWSDNDRGGDRVSSCSR